MAKLHSADFEATVHGSLTWPGGQARCALGWGGVKAANAKREGDGATPLADLPMRRVLFRADRLARPRTLLTVLELSPDMGWCDDPASPDYNLPIALPTAFSHEIMWREDALYDLLVVLGWNDDPPAPGRGSAIFLHLARPDYSPTEGCVATDLSSLLELLARAKPGDKLRISG